MLLETEHNLAFDTSLYKDIDPSIRDEVMAEDLAGFYIEGGERPLDHRINPRKLVIKGNSIYDPIRKRGVLEAWKGGNPLAESEKRGADLFYSYLKTHSLILSFSPEGGNSPYKESRINVAYKPDPATVHLYGIASNLSREKCLELWRRLNAFSHQPFYPTSSDDLREIPIPLNIEENVWDFLQKTIPLDSSAWSRIAERLPWREKEKMLEKARKVIKKISWQIPLAGGSCDYIRMGASMELLMTQETGWGISGFGCPGKLNSDIISSSRNKYVRDIFGSYRITNGETDDFGEREFTCPACGYVNKRPKNELIDKCQNKDCTNPSAVAC